MTTRSTPLAANALRLAVLSALLLAARGFASDGHLLNVDAATHRLDDRDAGPRAEAVRWVTCAEDGVGPLGDCLLYTSPSPRDRG